MSSGIQIQLPIRVCHISTMTRWGGVERSLVDLLNSSKNLQLEHKLIAPSSDREIIGVLQNSHTNFFQPKRQFRYDFRVALQMANWLREQQIAIAHSHNAFANVWGSLAAVLARVPVYLSHEHGTIWNVRPPLAWLDRLGHHHARMVIANSKATAALLEFKYTIPPHKIRVLYNAVPNFDLIDYKKARALLGIKDDMLVVGSIGRLDTPKDYATLIEAAAIVLKKRKNIAFALIGEGPLRRELECYIDRLGLRASFKLLGQRTDARKIIQGFDIFVSTSIRESLGNSLIEAALCGLPVIAPAVDGIPEVVLHQQTGILIEPTEPVRRYSSAGATPLPRYVFRNGKFQKPRSLKPAVLAETIINLSLDTELRRYYGQNAQRRAREVFSMKRYINELEEIYLCNCPFAEKTGENVN